MKKLVTYIACLGFLSMFSISSIAQNVAVVDIDRAVFQSQEFQDARKALYEEPEFAALIEDAQKIQAELQQLIEKNQKDGEIMSEEELAGVQKEFDEKSKDLEFLVGKIQTKETEMFQALFTEKGPLIQQILSELVTSKKIQILLNANRQANPNLLHADFSTDITSQITDRLDSIQAEAAAGDSE